MKKILFAIVILLLNLCAFAQTDPIRTEQNFIFQNINKRFIPPPQCVSHATFAKILPC